MEDYFEPTAWEPQDEPDDFDSNVDDADYEDYEALEYASLSKRNSTVELVVM